MEIQPPPGAQAPPASEHAVRSRRAFHNIVCLGVVSFLVLLAVLLISPYVFISRKSGDFVGTLGNAKQIGLTLLEFEREFGRYPDGTTLSEVKARTGTTMILGTGSSNEYLRQLLAWNMGNELMFHIYGPGLRRPDNHSIGGMALEKGECGFAYIPGLGSSSPLDIPVLIGPLLAGTDEVDTKRADGKIVALFADGSVKELPTDMSGHVLVRGKRLLNPTNSIWGGKPPALVWPE